MASRTDCPRRPGEHPMPTSTGLNLAEAIDEVTDQLVTGTLDARLAADIKADGPVLDAINRLVEKVATDRKSKRGLATATTVA